MSVTILFNVPDGQDDLDKIKIYKSSSENGTYEFLLEDDLQPYPYYQNYYILRDETLSIKDWFKVRFVDNSGNDGELSDAVNYLNPAIDDSPIMGNRWVLRNRMWKDSVVMDRNGEYANLYLRKTTGAHCSCWDANYQQGTFCEECYGTGFDGGYDVILNYKVRIDESLNRKVALTEYGIMSDYRPKVWIQPDFQLINGDIIERKISNKRYRVNESTAVALSGIITRYEGILTEIDLEDIAYKIGTNN